MKRSASAVWKGGLKDGNGTISTDSGVLSDAQYSFTTRFEQGNGTNPEELIAAAHAGCFSMALSNELGNAGLTPESISTTATVTLEKTNAGFAITAVHLTSRQRCRVLTRRRSRSWRIRRRPGVPSPSCSKRISRWMPHFSPEASEHTSCPRRRLEDSVGARRVGRVTG